MSIILPAQVGSQSKQTNWRELEIFQQIQVLNHKQSGHCFPPANTEHHIVNFDTNQNKQKNPQHLVGEDMEKTYSLH